MPTKKSDDWLIKNAISCWLHHFGDQNHEWESRYRELVKRDSYLPKPRPAKRQRSQSQRVADATTEKEKTG